MRINIEFITPSCGGWDTKNYSDIKSWFFQYWYIEGTDIIKGPTTGFRVFGLSVNFCFGARFAGISFSINLWRTY